MKLIIFAALLAFSANTYGQAEAQADLETDDRFFKSSVAPYEDDELDRIHKKNALIKTTEQQNRTESKVKDEFSSAAPGVMQSYEARAMDEKVIAENKRRQKVIMNQLSASSGPIHECVSKNAKFFQGTKATVIWMIGPDGKVLDTALKETDIENPEIQKCIQDVAMAMNFDEAKTDLYKKSHVEYTYKFKKRIVKPTSTAARAKKGNRSPASQ